MITTAEAVAKLAKSRAKFNRLVAEGYYAEKVSRDERFLVMARCTNDNGVITEHKQKNIIIR